MEKKVIYSLITLSAMSTAANAAAVQVDAYDFTKAEWGKVADVTFTSNKLTVSSGVAVKQTIGKLQKGDYILKIKVDKAGSSSATKVIAKIGGKTEEIAAVDFDKDIEVKFTLASETDVELELSSEPTDPKTPFAVDGFDLDLNFDFEAAISATLLEAQKVQTTIDGYTYSTQAEDKAAIDEIVNKLLLISASGTYADYEAYKLYDAEKALADEKAAITKLSTDSKNKEAKKTAYDAALADVSSFIAAEADFKALKEVVANSTYTAAKAAYDAAKTKYEAYKKAADDAAASSSVTFDFTEDPKVVTDAVAALNKAIKAHQGNYAVYSKYIAKYEASLAVYQGPDGKGGYLKDFNDWDKTLTAADKASTIKPYQEVLSAKSAADKALAAYKKAVEDAYAANNLEFATEPTDANKAVSDFNDAILAAKANKTTYVTLSAKVATAIDNFTKGRKEVEDYLAAAPKAPEALTKVVTENLQTLNTKVTTVNNTVTSNYQEGTIVDNETELDKAISDAETAITKAVSDNKGLKDAYNAAIKAQYQDKLDDVNGVTFVKAEYAAEAAKEKAAAIEALNAVKAFIDSKAAAIPAVTEESFKALIAKADKAIDDYKTRAQNVNDYHANLDDVTALQTSLDDAKKTAGDTKSADKKYTGADNYTGYAAEIQKKIDAAKAKVEENKAKGTAYKTAKEFTDAKAEITGLISNYATWTAASVTTYDAIVAKIATTTAKTFTDDIAKVKASEVYAANFNGCNDDLTAIEKAVEKLNSDFKAAMDKKDKEHYDAITNVNYSYDFVGELKKITDKLASEIDAYHLQVAINTYDTNLADAESKRDAALGDAGWGGLDTRIAKLTAAPQYTALKSALDAVKSLIDTEAGKITTEKGKSHTTASEYNASSAELLKVTEQFSGKIDGDLKDLKTKVKAVEDNVAAKARVDKEVGDVDKLLTDKKAEVTKNSPDVDSPALWTEVEKAIAEQKAAIDKAFGAADPTLDEEESAIMSAYKKIRTDIQNVVDNAAANQKAFTANNKAYGEVFPLVAKAQKAIDDAKKAINDADALNPNGAKSFFLAQLDELQTQLGADATSGIWKKLVDAHNHTEAGTNTINEQKPILEQMAKAAAAAATNSEANLIAYGDQNTALAELRVYQKDVAQKISDKLYVVKLNPDAYEKDKITDLSELLKTVEGYLTEIDAIDLLTGFAAGESATNGKLDDINAIDSKVRLAEAAIEDANNVDIEKENVAKKAALDAAVKAARTTYVRVAGILSPYQTIKDADLQAAFKPAAEALSSALFAAADNLDKLEAAAETDYKATKAPSYFDYDSDKITEAKGYEKAITDAETTFKDAVQAAIDAFWKDSRKDDYEGQLSTARNELSVWATTPEAKNEAIANSIAKVKAAQDAYDAFNVPALDDAVVALQNFDAELTAEKQKSTLAHYVTEFTNAESKLTALTFESPYEDLNNKYSSEISGLLNNLDLLRNNRLNNAADAFTYRYDLQAFVDKASVDFATNFNNDVAARRAAETQLNELQVVLDAAKAVVAGYTLDPDDYFKTIQDDIDGLRGKSVDVQLDDYNKKIEDALLSAIDDEKDVIKNALNTEYNKLLAEDATAAADFKSDVEDFKDQVTKLAPEGKALITDVAQLSSPYTEATEGSLTALLDGVTGNDNFWHSAWTGDKAKETVGSHYLQVEIAEPITTSTVYMEFTRRDKITTGHVTQWGVYGTNVPDATKGECEKLTTLSTPYVKLGEKITTDEFLTKGYKFIRLYIESTNSGNVFGHMSEFQLYTPDVAAESAALETLRDDAAQLSADMREAANAGLSAATLAGLNETIERLEGKTDFATDFPFVDEAEYETDLKELTAFIAEKKAFIEKNASKILYYKEDLEVALAQFETNELDPTRSLYEVRNSTNESRYEGFVTRYNNLKSQTEEFSNVFNGYDERTRNYYSWYPGNLEGQRSYAESQLNANKKRLYISYVNSNTNDIFKYWQFDLTNYQKNAANYDIQLYIDGLNATYAKINAVLSDAANAKDYAADVWADMLTRQSDISARITCLQNRKNDDTSNGSIFGNHDWLKDDAEYSYWSGSDYVTVEYSVTSIAADLEALLDQVRNGTLGDVDGDGEVNVTDYRTVLKFALENEDATAKDNPSYDVNQDGYIDVVDASAVVNVILYGDRRGEAYASVRGIEAGAQAAEAVALRVLNNDGETMRIAVDLTNNQAYTGFQLDVVLPEGMELIGQSLGERAANHDLLSNELSSGAIRIIGSSIKNEAFDGTEGAVLYLEVKRTDAYQGGEVAIQKVVFSDANAFATRFAVSSPITTGVSSTREQGIMGRIYDLGGRMVNSLKRGINIITGSDGTTRKVLK